MGLSWALLSTGTQGDTDSAQGTLPDLHALAQVRELLLYAVQIVNGTIIFGRIHARLCHTRNVRHNNTR